MIKHIGLPEFDKEVILFGLTVDCCILCLAQELSFRGYKTKVLEEATDTYSGSRDEKKIILTKPPLTNWATVLNWTEIVEN